MEHTKKMALVPHQLVSSLLAQQHLHPNIVQLNSLDQQMKAILDDSAVPADVKFKKYNHVLHQYMNLRDQELRPTPIPIQEIPAKSKLPDILDGIPKKSRNSAHLLLQHIEQNPEIDWNDKHELVLRGNSIQGSNIVDLIHDFSRQRTSIKPATGWREFANALQRGNISREAIGNKSRLEEPAPLAVVQESPDVFHSPPGLLGPLPKLLPSTSLKRKISSSTPTRKLRSNPKRKLPWSPY